MSASAPTQLLRTSRAGVCVVVLGPPGVERDAIVETLDAAGLTTTTASATELHVERFDVIVLLHPRRRDWALVAADGVRAVVVETVKFDELAAVLSGADALVTVDQTVDDLVMAVRSVASGGAVFGHRVARALLEAARTAPEAGELVVLPLARDELGVLHLIEHGESPKQIAADLDIPVKEVEELQRKALRKLGARNDAHAIALLAHGSDEGPGASAQDLQ